jgi:hypothetical protein
MTSERDCTETRENVSTSATSEVAAQAWDKSMWQGNAKCGNDSNLTHVDMGYNDIYNSNRGNHELNAGNRGLQTAENTINRTVDQLLDGNYDTNKIIKQLQGTDKGLSEATGDYKDAIKHLGASSTSENLDDLLDGRRDVMKADDKVGKAIEQLKNGDEAGAIKSLLQSLGKIDKAQDEFADAKTDENPRRQPHHGNLRDRQGDEDDYRRASNDGRVHDHMYRDDSYDIPLKIPIHHCLMVMITTARTVVATSSAPTIAMVSAAKTMDSLTAECGARAMKIPGRLMYPIHLEALTE